MLGCRAAAGIPVSDISKETQISRTYTYQQKASVQNYMESLDKAENHVLSINIDKGFIERMVLSLSLDCHASAEGIQRNFASVFGLHISYGKISSIIEDASKRAERFDAGIPLEGITQGANDEIFQGNIPVLTGIDTESTYVYLLTAAGDRSADTWQLFMEERREYGLGLEVSISDAGTGLNAGIPKAFPDICVQPDIFHELRPVGAEQARLERKAEKRIADESALEKRASGKRPQKKMLERLSQIHEKADMAIQEYDLLRILFCWLVELTGFSGYTFQDACGLAEWVLSEMEVSFPDRTKLLGDSYESARQEFCRILDHTKRASSLVENLNSRIRVYMNLKRMVPEKYFILL